MNPGEIIKMYRMTWETRNSETRAKLGHQLRFPAKLRKLSENVTQYTLEHFKATQQIFCLNVAHD